LFFREFLCDVKKYKDELDVINLRQPTPYLQARRGESSHAIVGGAVLRLNEMKTTDLNGIEVQHEYP
jgi:hypothetical protein